MAKISTVTSLQSSMGEKAPIASPTFTGLPTAPNYAVTVGGAHTFGYTPSATHQAGSAGSVALMIDDGGGVAGVLVENTHDGTYSSQEVVFKTSQGGVTVSTEYLRIKKTGRIAVNTATLVNAADDATAAIGGVAVGELYRNGSILMVRIA